MLRPSGILVDLMAASKTPAGGVRGGIPPDFKGIYGLRYLLAKA